VDNKDDDVGRIVKGPKPLDEGMQAMPLHVRTPNLPAVERIPNPLASRICGTQ
jgi:hypothetical protein